MTKRIMYNFYLLFSLIACVDDDTFINKSGSEYFPNKIGNYWEYSVIDSTHTSEGVKKYSVKITITATKKMADGKSAFVWQYQFPKWVDSYNYPAGIDTFYVRIENDTVKTFDRYYSITVRDLKYPRQTFPIPFQNGQKWNGRLLVIDSYVAVQTSDGYVINYHYIGPNIEYIDKLYFKPNIGFTMLDKSHYDLGPIDHQIWQLQKYLLK